MNFTEKAVNEDAVHGGLGLGLDGVLLRLEDKNARSIDVPAALVQIEEGLRRGKVDVQVIVLVVK